MQRTERKFLRNEKFNEIYKIEYKICLDELQLTRQSDFTPFPPQKLSKTQLCDKQQKTAQASPDRATENTSANFNTITVPLGETFLQNSNLHKNQQNTTQTSPNRTAKNSS